ncbi:hypothetical protein CASFOL_028650 [Castilleja foliolosa]|uniref:Protein FAR1-RELATED SEQUENCE n=1 Tax=Castilleja foliolosa TaxID=1961234 RepID=A0ABD3CF11_9LAMI
MARLLPAYRKIYEKDQEHIILLSKAGFPIHRIVKLLEREKGIQGGQLSFLERDVRNFIQNRKKVVQENDAFLTEKREIEMVDFLKACRANQEADPSFAYDFSVDENERVENIAWCFGDSVNAYDLFGDVVYFDSMYHSVSYGMRFGAWLGINSHGKIILFGCALLQDENPLSFAWALQAFLRFMKERYPQTIITDIDPGLVEAIRSEFPNTKHFISLYSNILPNLVLGSTRAKYRGCFLARMDSTTYWKPVNAFLKRLIETQTCLRGFLEQVGLQQSNDEEPQYMHLKTCLPIEENARNVLTPFAFDGMQQEMVLALECATSEMANGSYLVTHFKKVDRERLVVWIPGDEQIHCSCKEFESTGILCRHALRVLLLKNYFQLPSKYILDRWRQESSIFGFNEHSNLQNKDEWYREFDSLTGTLFSEAMLTKERSDFVHRELKKQVTRLVAQVRDMPAVNDVVMDVSLSPAEL